MPVTLRTTVHVPDAESDPPERLIDPDPAVAVPPHVFANAGVAATTSPAGSASVNDSPFTATELGLKIVNVRLVEPSSGIVEAPKISEIVGGAATVTLADAVFPVPPPVDPTAPVVLFCTPADTPVTLTTTVHGPVVPTLPPVRLTELDPAVAVTLPPQPFVSAFGVDTTRPPGSVSVKDSPLSGRVFGFVIVNVRLVELLSGTVVPPNAFAITGGAATFKIEIA